MEKLQDMLKGLPNLQKKIQEIQERNILNDSNQVKSQVKIQNVISDKCVVRECDGSGIIIVFDEAYGEGFIRCRCVEHRSLMKKIKSARIPSEYENSRVRDFDPNIYSNAEDIEKAGYAKQVAINYVEKFEKMRELGKGLYLHSDSKGTGKTHLIISIANALIQKYQVQPLYITSTNLLAEIKRTFQDNSESKSYALVETFKNAEVLIIDDFGAEKVSEWAEEVFTQIIDERMNYKRLTLYTSNYSIEQLNVKYKMGRISSRIEKTTLPVIMPTESIRSKIAKNENDEIFKTFFE